MLRRITAVHMFSATYINFVCKYLAFYACETKIKIYDVKLEKKNNNGLVNR